MAIANLFNKKKKVREFIDAGISKRDAEQYNGALLDFLQAVKMEPTNLEAQVLLGDVSFKTEKYSQALRSYDKVIRLQPDNKKAYNQKGKILWMQGQIDEAKLLFEQAMKLFPSYDHPLFNLAALKANVQIFDGDVRSRVASLKIKNKIIIANIGKKIGGEAFNPNSIDTEIERLEVYAEEHPKWPDTFFNWGTALMIARRFKEACEPFKRSIEVNPEYQNALLNWGAACFYMKDYKEAVKIWARLSEANPKHKGAHLNLAKYYRSEGDKVNAIAEMLLAAESEDDVRMMVIKYSNQAYAAYQANRFYEAEELFKKAHELKPNYPDILLYMGNSAFKMKEMDKALKYFVGAYKLNSEFKAAETNMNMVFDVLMKGSEAAQKIGQHNKAIRYLRQLADALPNNLKVHELLLKSYTVLRDGTQMEAAKEAIERIKNPPPPEDEEETD